MHLNIPSYKTLSEDNVCIPMKLAEDGYEVQGGDEKRENVVGENVGEGA